MKDFLDAAAARVNSRDFIAEDPVQFPRRFSKQPDIETAGLLAATIAWGNRRMICRDADRMLGLMADDPAAFTLEGAFEEIPDEVNIHRTFFGRNLKYYLRTLRIIFKRYGSVEAFAKTKGVVGSRFPAWKLVEELQKTALEANLGKFDSRCFPINLQQTALKRVNMAMRWFVRDDGIVDMGIWKTMKPSQLFIPLDVHVGKISRGLGLLERKSNDRKAVEELTIRLREYNPEDPCLYDFALFGIGIESGKSFRNEAAKPDLVI